MTNDDIAQKLALLPEGLAERNIESWNEAIKNLTQPVDAFIAEYFPYYSELGEVATAIFFSEGEQAKLFRAKGSYNTLDISTTDGPIKIGEPYLMVFLDRGFLTVHYKIEEEPNNNFYKKISSRTGDDVMSVIQPMLDLLWNETRGKKNA